MNFGFIKLINALYSMLYTTIVHLMLTSSLTALAISFLYIIIVLPTFCSLGRLIHMDVSIF